MQKDRNKTYALKRSKESLFYAVEGFKELFISQTNIKIISAASLAVILTALILQISRLDLCILVIIITLIWITEAFNTALEFVCDIVSPEFHPLIKKSKDVAAAATLIAVLSSILLGFIIFSKYIL